MRYAEYIAQTLVPISLQGPNGARWYTGMGEEKDYHKQRIMDSVALRFPTYAPADSLIQHGIDRQIERAPGESDASYRKRLLRAHATWRWAGTDYGVMLSFEAIGWQILRCDEYDSQLASFPFDSREPESKTYVWSSSTAAVVGAKARMVREHTYVWTPDAGLAGYVSSVALSVSSPTDLDCGVLYAAIIENAPDVYLVLYGDQAMTVEVAAGGLADGWETGGTVYLSGAGGHAVSGTAELAGSAPSTTGTITAQLADAVSPIPKVGPCAFTASDSIGYVLSGGATLGSEVVVTSGRSNVWMVAARDWTPPTEWTGGFDALWPVLDAHAQAAVIDYRPFIAFGKFAGTPSDYVAEVYPTKIVQRQPYLAPWGDGVWPASCALGENVLVFGGWSAGLGSALADTLVWDWGADDWQMPNPSTHPSARHSASMCEDAEGAAILVGGNNGASALSDTWRFALGEWTELTPTFAITPRYQAAMARLNGRIYLFGGTTNGLTALADTWVWDGANWTRVTTRTTPAGRFGHTLTTVGDKLVMFGGRKNGGVITNEVWTFDGSDWTPGFCLIPARVYHGAAAISDHELLVFGGDGDDSVYAWNVDSGSTTAYTSLPWTWSHGASAALRIRRTIRRRGQGDTRDGTHARGVAFTAAEVNAMLASIRKWKAADSTYPAMYLGRTPGGFSAVRSPCSVRGLGMPRGGRVTKIEVGER